MATKYEYYNTGQNSISEVYAAMWYAQTFTPTISHTINSVKLLLSRVGALGTVTVSIRATTGGFPSGGDLCIGTTNGGTLEVESDGEWREITFTSGYDLIATTTYAIVVRAIDAVADRLWWWVDATYPVAGYPNGEGTESSNSGGTWTDYEEYYDYMFEEWSSGFIPKIFIV